MANGVTMTDPSLVWIGPEVKIAQDVELLVMTSLLGKTSIEQDCTIGPHTRLVDTAVGRGCVLDETIALTSQIDDGVTCGPRAYLREGTHLCQGVKVGTHVEIKNSTVDTDSKVPHLSYIGDAILGKNVNIGAGTITCNYDGAEKHRTVVGDGAFIGSNTMLIAPVKIGEHATTGAGSPISKDVSAGSLGLVRAEQREISDWEKHRIKRREGPHLL
jgi:bifunctional UDP-N-acetylglucosamine pyrophosphorylase/glucosamine-1-phosphate N-acetyltransferase